MIVNGKPGRYKFSEGKWVFEEGDFNSNEFYDARVLWLIEKYGDQQLR